MEPSNAVSLRLITDLNAMLDHHCSLCLYFHDSAGSECNHHAPDLGRDKPLPPRPLSRFSDHSFYSAYTSNTSSTASSAKTIRATVTALPQTSKRQPFLRRKTSPTEISLRDLAILHQRQTALRAKQSDERLQQLYEEQILEYLASPDPEFDYASD